MSTRGPDDLLRHALHARADDTSYPATPVADVAARAGRMRRRRRGVVAGAVTAVALAAVVPTLALRGAQERGVEPASPADSAPPSIGYAVDGLYHAPDGSTVDVPDDATSVTPLGSQLLVTDDPGERGPLHLIRIGADGDRQQRLTSSWPVVDLDGAVTYTVVDDRGRTRAVVDDADGSRIGVVGLTGRTGVLGRGSAGERLVVADSDGDVSSLPLSGEDAQPIDLPGDGLPGAHNSATGRFVVFTDVDDVTSAVTDGDGTELWGFDDDSVLLAGFSPSGRYVTSNGPDGEFQVREASTGDLVTEFAHDEPADSFEPFRFRAVAWEDETHLVGLERGDDGLLHAVRLDLDGDVTRIEGMAPVADENDFVWQTRP